MEPGVPVWLVAFVRQVHPVSPSVEEEVMPLSDEFDLPRPFIPKTEPAPHLEGESIKACPGCLLALMELGCLRVEVGRLTLANDDLSTKLNQATNARGVALPGVYEVEGAETRKMRVDLAKATQLQAVSERLSLETEQSMTGANLMRLVEGVLEQRDELAALNGAMREAVQKLLDADDADGHDDPYHAAEDAVHALLGRSAPVLAVLGNDVEARIWEKAGHALLHGPHLDDPGFKLKGPWEVISDLGNEFYRRAGMPRM